MYDFELPNPGLSAAEADYIVRSRLAISNFDGVSLVLGILKFEFSIQPSPADEASVPPALQQWIDDGESLEDVQNNQELISQDSEKMAATFFRSILTEAGFTTDQINAGLDKFVYDSLPTYTPSASPAWAVVCREQDEALQLAWFNDADGSWTLSDFPYNVPFIIDQHLVKQNPGNGAGNNAWRYAMGLEFRALRTAKIKAGSIKLGSGVNTTHRWELLKSTELGISAPSFNTYTEIVQSGEVSSPASANQWRDVELLDVDIAENEWYIFWFYVGAGGQFANISTLRNAGELAEDIAELNAGVFRFINGSNPGPTPLGTPTSRQTDNIYGIASVLLGG